MKLPVTQLGKFLSFYGTSRFIIMSTEARPVTTTWRVLGLQMEEDGLQMWRIATTIVE
jgi:hypothetical protein